MINVSKTILFSTALSVISFTAHAKIYSDQIVLDKLGEDVCLGLLRSFRAKKNAAPIE